MGLAHSVSIGNKSYHTHHAFSQSSTLYFSHSDANGNLQPDPKQWPSGINTTIAYVHSLGLGFGLYGDRGTQGKIFCTWIQRADCRSRVMT